MKRRYVLLGSLVFSLCHRTQAKSSDSTLSDSNSGNQCLELQLQKDCQKNPSQRLVDVSLQVKKLACQEQFASLGCESFFREFPEFNPDRLQCSEDQVCEQGSVQTFFEGCRDYGIEINESFVAELKKNVQCLRNQTCIKTRQQQNLFMPTFLFFQSLINWKGQLSQVKKELLKDLETYRHLNCLKKKIKNQFLCHLHVKYGAAVLSVSPTGAGTKELLKVQDLELKLARSSSILKSKGFEKLKKAFEESDNVLLMKGRKSIPMIEGLEKNKSYTVIIYEDRLVLGDDYFGPDGTRKASHVKLFTDTTIFINRGKPPQGWNNLGYKDRGGAVKIYEDGSIDVSGYHLGADSAAAADRIAEHILKVFPDSTIRKTPGRLDTLAPKGD